MYISHPKKLHVGKLESYLFDEEVLNKALEENADENKRVNSLRGQWTASVGMANLRKKEDNHFKSSLNGARVSRFDLVSYNSTYS